MIGALLLITRRQWVLHKLRLALTTLGIALGVAVFFAIQSSNSTLVDSLHTTIEKLAGKATLQVTGGETGFPQDFLDTVRSTPGVAIAEPVTETIAISSLGANEKLLILGLDTNSDLGLYSDMFEENGVVVRDPLAFTSKADSVAISRKFADRFGLKDGDQFSVVTQAATRELTVRGIFRSTGAGDVYDGSVAVMDIGATQAMFGKTGVLDRIDIMNSADVEPGDLERRIAAKLPAGIRVERPDIRGQSMENAVSSMNFGLAAMSFLAFIICGYLIFNSFAISVNQRWHEIGILRAIGVERRHVQQMFLAEAAVIGLIGSMIGVGAGFVLARTAIKMVVAISTTMYGFVSSPKDLSFDLTLGGEAIVAGVIASLLAAWIPSRTASRLDPAAALHNVETIRNDAVSGLPRFVCGVLMIAIALVMIAYTTPEVGGYSQYIFALLITVGMILLLPKIIEVGARILRPLMNRAFGAEGLLAVETLARAPRRTASTVGALMVGLAFVFSVGALIMSQKAALNRQIDKSLDAQIVVASSQQLQASTYHFSQETADKIASLPGIERSDILRVASVEYRGETVSVLAHDMDAYFAISPDLLDYGDPASARAATSSGNGVLVSNNLAMRFNLHIGDLLKLDTPGGTLELPVVGMLDYYRSEVGTIFLDRKLYQRYWNDTQSDYVLIDLRSGIDPAAFKAQILAAVAGDRNAFVYTHEEFKAWVASIIDQFFTLMYLQVIVAMVVAALGLANTMIISVDERQREIGIFRAIGGLRWQVVKMVLLEAVAISLIGLMAAAVLGAFNAYFLVNTAAKVVAGFTIRLVAPYWLVLASIPFVVVIAILSAMFPARKAAKLRVIEAIGYE